MSILPAPTRAHCSAAMASRCRRSCRSRFPANTSRSWAPSSAGCGRRCPAAGCRTLPGNPAPRDRKAFCLLSICFFRVASGIFVQLVLLRRQLLLQDFELVVLTLQFGLLGLKLLFRACKSRRPSLLPKMASWMLMVPTLVPVRRRSWWQAPRGADWQAGARARRGGGAAGLGQVRKT